MTQAQTALRIDLIKQLGRIRLCTGLKRKKAINQFKEIVRVATKDGIPLTRVVDLIDIITTMEKRQ